MIKNGIFGGSIKESIKEYILNSKYIKEYPKWDIL